MSIVEHHVGDAVASATCWVVAQGVAVEHWPPDGARAHDPDRYRHRPMLFLVQPGTAPPALTDELAMVVQLPTDPDELVARARTLVARARTDGVVLTYVDPDDVLRVGNRLVVLSPIEARIMRVLLDHPGRVVSRDRLNQEIWPDKAKGDHVTLNGRVRLLRAHIAGLPLHIHSVRRRGLLLEITGRPDHLRPSGRPSDLRPTGRRSTSPWGGGR